MTAQPRLQLVTFSDPAAALAIAVRLTMRHPVSPRCRSVSGGRISRQAERGHQAFVIDEAHAVRGFFGYALASKNRAEAWAHGTPA